MIRTLIVTILVAFVAGLVAETAVAVAGLTGGVVPTIHTGIELVVCWGVVLASFVACVIRTTFGRWN